jgi:hypothetical protein
MTCVLGRDVASWDGDRERPRTPLQDVRCDGASGTLARVPGRSERPETGWRVPGQFGRPGTVWEAFRTGEVSRDGAQRPGTGGASWDAQVPVRSRPHPSSRLRRPKRAETRPRTVWASWDGCRCPRTARASWDGQKASRDGCCVLRRWRASWDGANVLRRQAVSQDGENVLGRCVGRPGTARCSVLGRRRASWDRDARTSAAFGTSGFTIRFTRFTRFTTH